MTTTCKTSWVGRLKPVTLASALVIAISGFSTAGVAAPFATSGATQLAAPSLVVEAQAKRKRAQVVRNKRNRAAANAAVGAAIGLGVLGVAAAAAASQRQPRGVYYTDEWGRPVRGYRAPVQYYQDDGWGYEPAPVVRRQPRLSDWERRELLEQQRQQRVWERDAGRRAQRDAERRFAREQQLRAQERAFVRERGWREQPGWGEVAPGVGPQTNWGGYGSYGGWRANREIR
jgi:hypothetical protein